MINRRSIVNLGWLALVNLMWASQFPAYRLAADHMSASALSFYVFAVACLTLLPFLARERRRKADRGASGLSRWSVQVAGRWALLAVFGLLPPSILMSWGIEHSSGSNASILTLMIPLLMLVLAVPLLGEKLTWVRVSSLAVALVGAVLISGNELRGGQFSSSTLAGNLIILSACVGSAFYNIYSKRLLQRYTELEVLVYGYVLAAGLCAIASTCLDAKPFYDVTGVPPSTWQAILVLGVVTWGVSMVLFMWLLTRVDLGQVSASIYMLSFFGVVFSALTLGERVHLYQIVGGLLVAAATLLADAYERRSIAIQSISGRP